MNSVSLATDAAAYTTTTAVLSPLRSTLATLILFMDPNVGAIKLVQFSYPPPLFASLREQLRNELNFACGEF